MKKLLLAIPLLSMMTTVFAGSLVNYAHDCDATTQYCVYFKADQSITQPVTAKAFTEAMVDDSHYFQNWNISLSKGYTNYAWVDLNQAKFHKIDYITHGISHIGASTIADCKITVTEAQLIPGIHTLLITKTDSGYTCKRMD